MNDKPFLSTLTYEQKMALRLGSWDIDKNDDKLVPINSPDGEFIYHGQVRHGKSECILLSHLKCVHIPGYVGFIACRTKDVLWDKAKTIFGAVGGRPIRDDKPRFVFPSGAEVHFKYPCHGGVTAECIAVNESCNILYGGGRGCGKTASFFAENEDQS